MTTRYTQIITNKWPMSPYDHTHTLYIANTRTTTSCYYILESEGLSLLSASFIDFIQWSP